MMNLYTASHYKNSPNDLQLIADAPAQRLFVLLPRTGAAGNRGVPEPLAVLQVALEGHVSRSSVLNALARGERGDAGDLIPWTLSQQFQDPEFASQLSGARIVRVAVRADAVRMGYGRRAVGALREFYAGAWKEGEDGGKGGTKASSGSKKAFVSLSLSSSTKEQDLHSESITIRSGPTLPALLHRLSTLPTPPEKLDWLGVSYGMTPSLLRFWNRAGYGRMVESWWDGSIGHRTRPRHTILRQSGTLDDFLLFLAAPPSLRSCALDLMVPPTLSSTLPSLPSSPDSCHGRPTQQSKMDVPSSIFHSQFSNV